MRDDFTDQLIREKKSVEDALIGLANARQLNQNQSKMRIATLTILKRRLDDVQQELEKILRAAILIAPGATSQSGPSQDDAGDDVTNESWADE